MGALSHNGPHASTLRVRNVDVTGFEWQIDEWPGYDGHHMTETVSYLVAEAGVHSLDGITFAAGIATLSTSW